MDFVHVIDILIYIVFISEITARAFIEADANKRRTLSRQDIAKALSKSDQFDFLIDIVPREEGIPGAKKPATSGQMIPPGIIHSSSSVGNDSQHVRNAL